MSSGFVSRLQPASTLVATVATAIAGYLAWHYPGTLVGWAMPWAWPVIVVGLGWIFLEVAHTLPGYQSPTFPIEDNHE